MHASASACGRSRFIWTVARRGGEPFLDVSSHPQALVIGPCPSRPVRVGSTGACFIFYFEPETRVRPLRGAASHEVFCSLQRLQVALRCRSRGSQPRTVPLRRSIVRFFRRTMSRTSAIAGGFGLQPIMRLSAVDRSRPCGFGSALCALRVGPCAARAAGTITVHTPVRPGHASRSLFGATFRYPNFVEPSHNRAAHPHFVRRASCAATLMGFSHPSQCSPSAGPGVCDARRSFLGAPSSPPFIPTCRYRIHIAPLIFTAVGRARLRQSTDELLPHTSE